MGSHWRSLKWSSEAIRGVTPICSVIGGQFLSLCLYPRNCEGSAPHPQEVSQILGTIPASQFLDQNLEPGHPSPATATLSQSENLSCPIFTRIQIQPPLPTATTLVLTTDVLLTAVDSRCPCFPHSLLSAQWLRQLLQSGCQIVSLLCCKPAYPSPNPCTYTTLLSTACFPVCLGR